MTCEICCTANAEVVVVYAREDDPLPGHICTCAPCWGGVQEFWDSSGGIRFAYLAEEL